MNINRRILLNELSDESLMRKVAGGDLDVLQILFRRHHKYIFNFLYKMSGDSMLSEDMTQEVFYKVIKHRSSYDNGKFISWIFTIARNTFRTHYRRNKENHRCLESIDYKYLEAETEKDYSDLMKALNKLDQGDKELLVLHKFQKIKYREIAEITESTPGAVKTRISRAMKKLRTIYFENL